MKRAHTIVACLVSVIAFAALAVLSLAEPASAETSMEQSTVNAKAKGGFEQGQPCQPEGYQC